MKTTIESGVPFELSHLILIIKQIGPKANMSPSEQRFFMKLLDHYGEQQEVISELFK